MLSQMQKKEIENTILNINRVNENTYITWDELVESVNHDILSYETMYKYQSHIIDFIVNGLGQSIEVY